MTTQKVADKDYELARANKWYEIVETLYHDDIICIEPPNSKSPAITKGKENVLKKASDLESMTEVWHSGYCTTPIVAGKMFSVGLGYDLTIKGEAE